MHDALSETIWPLLPTAHEDQRQPCEPPKLQDLVLPALRAPADQSGFMGTDPCNLIPSPSLNQQIRIKVTQVTIMKRP